MRLKPGASIDGLRTEMLFGLVCIEPLFVKERVELVITSGTDGVHMQGSKHYEGLAVDIRSRTIRAENLSRFIVNLKDALGVDFDVVLENDHIHIEYDPKKKRV